MKITAVLLLVIVSTGLFSCSSQKEYSDSKGSLERLRSKNRKRIAPDSIKIVWAVPTGDLSLNMD